MPAAADDMPWDADAYAARHALLVEAAALAATERAAFLAERCGGDATLRSDVEAMLRVHDGSAAHETADALRDVAARAADALRADHSPPSQLGSWTLLERIAEGGMGVVYKARQERPERLAAIKFLRPELASERAVRRLELEAEVLAQFDHPGIAKVYAMGVVEDEGRARPYFAMEFVEGKPIDRYADEAGLDVDARIDLLCDVCSAVDHAHRRGVIHRDLKPGNILVTPDGRVKVLDFGVARVARSPDATASLHLTTGGLLGTLAYMGPEQIVGDQVSTSTDVYALGVVLFQLLTGRLPLDVGGQPLARAAERIQHETPPLLGSLDARLKGDLEVVVATALAKDPARRYLSAAALADDLRHVQRREPIRARPPHALYLLGRFVARHRAAVSIASLLLTALVGSLVLAMQSVSRERKARAQADLVSVEARKSSYQAALATALLGAEMGYTSQARHALERAPLELRRWEWDLLAADLDESARVLGSDHELLDQGVLLGDGVRIAFAVQDRDAPAAQRRLRIVDWRTGDVLDEREAPELQLARAARIASWVEADGSVAYAKLDEPGLPVWRQSPELAGEDTGRVPADVLTGPPVVSGDGTVAYRVTRGTRVRRTDLFQATHDPIDLSIEGVRTDRGFATSHDGAVVAVRRRGNPGIVLHRFGVAADTVIPFPGTRGIVGEMAFDATGTRLLVCSGDGRWTVSDVWTGEELAGGGGEGSSMTGAAFSPDGRVVATTSGEGRVRLWDTETGLLLRTLRGHPGGCHGPSFDPSGRVLVTMGLDGRARVWDLGPDAPRVVLGDHESYVYGVAASPDGRRLATAAWDGTVRVFDALSGRALGHVALPDVKTCFDVVWTPDGRHLIVHARMSPAARELWWLDARTLRIQEQVHLPASPGWRSPVYDPSLRGVWLGTQDGVGLCQAKGQVRLHGEVKNVRGVDVAGALLVCAGEGRLGVIDTSTGKLLRQVELHSPANRVQLSPDGRQVAVAHVDGRVSLFGIASGKLEASAQASDGRLFALAFVDGGRRLLTGGDDGRVAIWSVPELEPLADLRGHNAYVMSLCVACGGRTVASASGDTTVRLWSTIPWAERRRHAEAFEGALPAWQQRVATLHEQLESWEAVADALEADRDLTDLERDAGRAAVLAAALQDRARSASK